MTDPDYPPPTGRGPDAVAADMIETLLRLATFGLDNSQRGQLRAYANACKATYRAEAHPDLPPEADLPMDVVVDPTVPPNTVMVVSGVRREEMRPGETLADAIVRLGRYTVIKNMEADR